jgi:hypothetical protein
VRVVAAVAERERRRVVAAADRDGAPKDKQTNAAAPPLLWWAVRVPHTPPWVFSALRCPERTQQYPCIPKAARYRTGARRPKTKKKSLGVVQSHARRVPAVCRAACVVNKCGRGMGRLVPRAPGCRETAYDACVVYVGRHEEVQALAARAPF